MTRRIIRTVIDTREPDPHPWEKFAPENIVFIRAGMETGDFCLAALPDGAIVERKTPSDLAGCLASSRERFERELKRSRHYGAFCVVVEGNLSDVCLAARGMSMNAVIGTLAAWSRRYCPIIFAGGVEPAANFAFRFLMGQISEIERQSTALAKAAKEVAP